MYKRTTEQARSQGRPLNVNQDARCVLEKVGGESKKSKLGGNYSYNIYFELFNFNIEIEQQTRVVSNLT